MGCSRSSEFIGEEFGGHTIQRDSSGRRDVQVSPAGSSAGCWAGTRGAAPRCSACSQTWVWQPRFILHLGNESLRKQRNSKQAASALPFVLFTFHIDWSCRKIGGGGGGAKQKTKPPFLMAATKFSAKYVICQHVLLKNKYDTTCWNKALFSLLQTVM